MITASYSFKEVRTGNVKSLLQNDITFQTVERHSSLQSRIRKHLPTEHHPAKSCIAHVRDGFVT
ncbi:UNVERIFIED_CONTAM: hypothetical protein FKN15_002018 [Acipenser sinensis]